MKLNYKILFVVIFLFVLPTIQLGLSFYLSVSFIAFLTLFLLSLYNIKLSKKISNYLVIGALMFILKSTTLLSEDNREILIVLRELLCFIGVIIISSLIEKNYINFDYLQYLILAILTIMLIFELVQLFYLERGILITYPYDYFITNKATLESSDLALFHETRYRVTCFYGEPSYTSFITFSLFVINLLIPSETKYLRVIIVVLSFMILIIAQALSGVTSLIVFLYIFILNKKGDLFSIILFLSFVSLGFLLSGDLIDRVYLIFNGNDDSFDIRFVQPLILLTRNFSDNNIIGTLNYTGILQFVDNAIFGLFLHYGILAFGIFIVLYYICNNLYLFIYILIASNFNGAFFSFDKCIIFSLVLGVIKNNSYFKVRLLTLFMTK